MISKTFSLIMLIMPFISNAFIYLQAYKIYKRQSHDDLSFLTQAFSIVSAFIWGYYGYSIKSMPLLLSGIIASFGFILIVLLKLIIPTKSSNGWKYI